MPSFLNDVIFECHHFWMTSFLNAVIFEWHHFWMPSFFHSLAALAGAWTITQRTNKGWDFWSICHFERCMVISSTGGFVELTFCQLLKKSKWGSVNHQMVVPAPSISCRVLNHHNSFYQIQNAQAFNRNTCCHLVLCLQLLPFHYDATTLIIITTSIMTFSIIVFLQHFAWKALSIKMLYWALLCFIYCCTEFHYAECYYAGCRYAECRGAKWHPNLPYLLNLVPTPSANLASYFPIYLAPCPLKKKFLLNSTKWHID
jgi:hypothetical protein